ncbi:glycoside hydrolase family 3 N-terminal domain-containing protein [Bacteroides sp. GD17]|jgi:beta-glucosidase|uniref:glycoside hydrolase family 3 N-terminal domain-containing protein n=1 Tax=Bacteroides sp. GD17 TaxID=3139826 RepID=UPI0025CDA8E6|nr:glycoside hydrolase family 3 N-terminal domain-containing protein [uncultured Bacteroides sp.]
MNKHILWTVASLLFCTQATGAMQDGIYHKGWIDFNKNGKMDIYEDPGAPLEDRVQDLLSQMTLEEKTCQMATLYGSGRVLKDALPQDSWKTEVWKDGIGNIDEEHNGLGSFKSEYSFPYTRHVEAKHAIQRWFVEETRLGIPVDFTNEGIRGLCHDRATYFPAQCGQGATWNKELIARIGEVEAREAVALGYTNIYSPILDIAQDPRWGRCVETYGEDPYLVGQLGKQMINSLQKHNLVATPKHFAVYSIPVGGRDGKTRTDPHVAPREMRTLYIEPFRVAFQEAGALGVMSSYNDYDGEPITGSYHFLTEILRQEWGFKGYVVSDSEAVEFISNKHKVADSYEDGIAQAVNAGLNVRTHFTPPADYVLPLRKAVADGKISPETIDKRVAEILRVKFWLGLFDKPYRGDGKQAEQIVHSKEHQAVSLEAARQSLVLLKNENKVLPLSKSVRSVAVIGPNADEHDQLICRYGPANAPIKTVYRGIKEMLPQAEVVYKKGCDIVDPHFPESELLDFPKTQAEATMMEEAVEAAKQAEVVVMVLGGNELTVREDRSRTSLDLAGRQEELLKAVYATGKPVVLVLMDGRAASINYAAATVPAILHAWFPGEFCGQAVAEALFGDYNPGGRLAVTFPKSVGQIPFAFPFKPGSDESSETSVYGALFPFGYGLSYTTFAYSDLAISPLQQGVQGEINVSCKVKNTGTVRGDEVVQLYLRDEVSSVTTYTKVLRGFERISLQPGEEQTVHFKLRPQDLGLWDKNMNFCVEPGNFKVMIGASSADIRLEGEFEIVASHT